MSVFWLSVVIIASSVALFAMTQAWRVEHARRVKLQAELDRLGQR